MVENKSENREEGTCIKHNYCLLMSKSSATPTIRANHYILQSSLFYIYNALPFQLLYPFTAAKNHLDT